MLDVTAGQDGRMLLPDGQPLRTRGTLPQPGHRARTVVRPESLRVLRDQESADNVLDVHVDMVVLSGAMTRVHARLAGGMPIVAALPSRFDGVQLQEGQRARLGFDQSAAVTLPADATAAAVAQSA
jgi:hypothetical protein